MITKTAGEGCAFGRSVKANSCHRSAVNYRQRVTTTRRPVAVAVGGRISTQKIETRDDSAPVNATCRRTTSGLPRQTEATETKKKRAKT